MTENEAIGVIKRLIGISPSERIVRAVDIAVSTIEEIQQYREIGTVEECREARERQRGKKPIRIDMCTCPNCGTHNEIIKKRRNTVLSDIVYCWHCGQAMEIRRGDTP